MLEHLDWRLIFQILLTSVMAVVCDADTQPALGAGLTAVPVREIPEPHSVCLKQLLNCVAVGVVKMSRELRASEGVEIANPSTRDATLEMPCFSVISTKKVSTRSRCLESRALCTIFEPISFAAYSHASVLHRVGSFFSSTLTGQVRR